MMRKFQEALAFDIHLRRDVDEKFPAEGVRVLARDIREGVVYESNGVKVTAFLVDHGPVKPAFGYRIDFSGRSVALSGDTGPSANLVKFSAASICSFTRCPGGSRTLGFRARPTSCCRIPGRLVERRRRLRPTTPMAWS